MLGDCVDGPATPRLTGGKRGCLVDCPWSSLRHYQKGDAPEWQPMDRVLEAFRLSQDRRGRKAYVSWLDARAENEGGKIEAGTSVKNDWLASPLRMGHPAAMSQLVSHTLKDPKSLKILKKHDKTYKSKD